MIELTDAGPRGRSETWAAPWWKLLGRRYGHVLHSLCSYMGSFPAGLPRYFIEQFSEEGDMVLDPFSGRGTTALEACLAGRIGIGVDKNPLAALLTDAKVDPPSLREALARIDRLEAGYSPRAVGERAPPEIKMLFEEGTTLPQLLHIKDSLDPGERTDRFVLASLAGILHGHHTREVQNSRCLSVSMPNTFSMSPGYLRKYITDKGLTRHPFDVFEKLRARMLFEFADPMAPRRGRGLRADARALSCLIAPKSARLIVTSPPYLNVVRYGKFNWIRLWLMGESVSDVDTSLRVEKTDRRLALSDRLGLKAYAVFLRDTLRACETVLCDDGVCVLTIGDVTNTEHGEHQLAHETWEAIRHEVPFELAKVIVDDVNEVGKVSKIWGENRKGRATRTERVLVLHKRGQSLPRPRFLNPKGLISRLSKLSSGLQVPSEAHRGAPAVVAARAVVAEYFTDHPSAQAL